MTTITVIITTYNSEKHIERALKSVFSQNGYAKTFLLDVIVVDDCSNDDTIVVIKKFPIRFFSTQKNSGGPNKGRNVGLKYAIGDYICIMDHDDQWLPHKIETQLKYLSIVKGSTLIATSGYTIINSNGSTDERYSKAKNRYRYFVVNRTFRNLLKRNYFKQNCYLGGIIFQNSLKNVFFEEEYGQLDWDWVLRIFHNNDSVEICESLYVRYLDGNNLSLNEIYRMRDYNYGKQIIEKYRVEYPKEVAIGEKKIAGTLARYFYLIGQMQKARYYFSRSTLNIKTILFFVTSFVGHQYIRKKIHFFG